jgi:hypothetical protein
MLIGDTVLIVILKSFEACLNIFFYIIIYLASVCGVIRTEPAFFKFSLLGGLEGVWLACHGSALVSLCLVVKICFKLVTF